MKVYTVEGSVIDSGYVVYGVFTTKEAAQKLIDDNWIWGYTYKDSERIVSEREDHNGDGPDLYCSRDEVAVVEYELDVPIEIRGDWYIKTPPAWRL